MNFSLVKNYRSRNYVTLTKCRRETIATAVANFQYGGAIVDPGSVKGIILHQENKVAAKKDATRHITS